MPFKIISVTGAHSCVGKTTLCSILLENFKGLGAIKYTKTPLFTSVIDDQDVILQKDKDTEIMYRSGAEKVVWVRSGENQLEEALHIALGKMEDLRGVIIEGNGPARCLSPDLTIFIIGEDGRTKPSAGDLIEKADIVIINTGAGMQDPVYNISSVPEGKQTFQIDLSRKSGEIDKFLSHIKKYIME